MPSSSAMSSCERSYTSFSTTTERSFAGRPSSACEMRSSVSADSAPWETCSSARASTGSKPSSNGSARWRRRRWTCEDAVLAVMRYSQVENAESPRNLPMPFQARRYASCTTSCASSSLPVRRRASVNVSTKVRRTSSSNACRSPLRAAPSSSPSSNGSSRRVRGAFDPESPQNVTPAASPRASRAPLGGASAPGPVRRPRRLPGLFVDRVPAVPAAVLLHLDPLAVVHLALDRDVVPPLAFLAGERDLHSLLVLGHIYSLALCGAGSLRRSRSAVLLLDLDDAARTHGPATLTDREPQPLIHRDRLLQLHRHLGVITRHHHLRPLRQIHRAGHIRRPEIELRMIIREERRMPTALLLRQDVHLRRELRVRRNTPRLRQHLPPLHILFLRPPQQRPNVVARPTLIQQLPEHLHTRTRRLRRRPQPDDLDLLPHLHLTALHPARHHRPPTRNREHILDRHQKRLIDIPRRLRHRRIHRRHQLQNRRRPLLITLQRLQRRHPHHRRVIPRKLILVQQLPDLELHQLQDLLIINHVRLVQRHHNRRHPHLTRQQHMLTRLRHRTIRRRHHQNRAIHLRRTRNHVLDVIRMPRTIHMRVMTILRLILHMRDRNRDPPRLLPRRLIDLIKRRERILRILIMQNLRNRRRQRRLPMVNMTNRPDVQVRLRALKLRFRHWTTSTSRFGRRCCGTCRWGRLRTAGASFATYSGDDLLRD